MSKVIKGVISGLKATKYGKNTKNHCVYKLHSRVTSLAHMHCYHQGSLECQPFGGQRSLRGHFRSKTKCLKNVQEFLFQDVNTIESHDFHIWVIDT